VVGIPRSFEPLEELACEVRASQEGAQKQSTTFNNAFFHCGKSVSTYQTDSEAQGPPNTTNLMLMI
jgi:hypothetical protein